MADDLSRLDAVEQAALVRRGEATPRELVDAAIARIEEVDPTVQAVLHRRFEQAQREASSDALPAGPFRGVPILLKDLGAQAAGEPYHAGMRALRDADWREPEDSYFTAKLRRAGFVVLGRTLLADPVWPLRAAKALRAEGVKWPVQYERSDIF